MSRSSEIEKEARKLSDLFEEVEEFWKGRGNEEAAGFAHMAKEGAMEAAKAARKKEQKSLEAAITTIAASCEGCHKESHSTSIVSRRTDPRQPPASSRSLRTVFQLRTVLVVASFESK